MNRMTPEFEAYAKLLNKQSGPVSSIPDFDPAWIGKSPRIEVEESVMEPANQNKNVVNVSSASRRGLMLAAAAVLVGVISVGVWKFGFKEAPVNEGHSLKAAVVFVKGDAKLIRDHESPLHKGDLLNEGDQIVTGDKTSVDIGLTDSSVIRLKENTRLVLKGLRETEASQVKLSLLSGKLMNLVEKENKNANFVVDTPTVVAAVRGTAFEVSASDQESTVFVSEGSVEVTTLVREKSVKVITVGNLIVVTADKDELTEDPDRAKKTLPEYAHMRKNLSGLDKELLDSTRHLKTAKTEKELSEIYNLSVEHIILKDGRELRGVVVSQKKGKLVVQTLKGSYILDEEVVDKIRYAD
ncbi:iron dicitrate transport regulator FecR [Leptospira perolatii]|uniref:Iron dicitrate transport regulator FecR n=1 Tax=Leptospira perolatii TaxID=2023191 RepID=A0A2M9ZIE3_9LEPT|nr:FecR domain-containing protein [Leptospira perolatii]PJZ68338.1 iron dicitrate transport regulator FecR [Leptospira perolatii]PJZ71826.1 iron dicitrate transport regulator FecR [Leptospira perolatii]